MKNFCGFLLFLILFFSVSSVAYAKDDFTRIDIEKGLVNKPEIEVYFKFIDEDQNVVNKGNIDAQKLKVILQDEELDVKKISNFRNNENGNTYIVLLDVSGSIRSKDFEIVKAKLNTWISGIGVNDSFILITFGEQVNVLLKGEEDREQAKNKVENLKNNSKGTKFKDAVYKAVNIAKSDSLDLPQRKVMILITDGKDYSQAGVTDNEFRKQVEVAEVPIFSVAVPSSKSENISLLGELSRSTGANVYFEKEIEKSVDDVLTDVNIGYFIKCISSDNMITQNEATLKVEFTDGESSMQGTKTVQLSDYIKDTSLPRITNVKNDGEKKIIINFSEKVINAEKASSYELKSAGGDSISIISSTYKDKKAVLQLSDSLKNEEYTLSTYGISDYSMEKNKLDRQQVSFTPEVKQEVEKVKWGLIIVFIALGLITVVLIIIMLSKKNKISDGVRIRLKCADLDGYEIDINEVIVDRLTIGRGSEADINLDDDELSRLHCTIVLNKDGLYLLDNDSTNGTFLNGEEVTDKIELCIGDKIGVGQHTIEYLD